MTEESISRIPPELQPTEADVECDLDATLKAVVSLRAQIPETAFTAGILGTERTGHGVVLEDSGLIVTIGYLITEATEVWIVTANGTAIPGDVLGYDYETGFGLVQPLGQLDLPGVPIGEVDSLDIGDFLLAAGFGGRSETLKTQLASRREFAGYWEYVLDDALYTSPPHPNWGGAALLNLRGQLCGIGSLFVEQIVPELPDVEGNLFVPINLLPPIIDDLKNYGRSMKPARPWLGMFVSETENGFMVAGAYDNAPAEQHGVKAGDMVLEINGHSADSLADLFRIMWAVGPAGTAIPLRLERDGKVLDIDVGSVDRRDFWLTPNMH